jgi:hypothetical protein
MDPRARLAFASLALTSLVACGAPAPHPREQADSPPEAQAPGRATEQTVFDDLIKTEDRARAVEGVTQDAKAASDKAIAASEGGGSGDQ